MPDFRPFAALRYDDTCDFAAVLSPPYDVLTDQDAARLRAQHRNNITRIDVPENQDYKKADDLLDTWVGLGVLTADADETFTIYRLSFTDATGAPRQIVGVLGGLEVVDELDPEEVTRPGRPTTVLPHERTTPKAKTDRLELTRATSTNLSPVWGLSLASGLTDLLQAPGSPEGSVEIDGITHTVEKISDPERIAAIRAVIAADDVLIADGHHRYAISRAYRDEVRRATERMDTRAEQTLTFINELIDDQLSIEAIHRLYSGISAEELRAQLATRFDFEPLEAVEPETLGRMVERARLIVMWPDATPEWLIPRPAAFDTVRSLDGAWLEATLEGSSAEVSYQHGLTEVKQRLAEGGHTAAILIRPTSIDEIRRTAREGLLMPPKSTFFTPKLLTGWVLRPTKPLPERMRTAGPRA